MKRATAEPAFSIKRQGRNAEALRGGAIDVAHFRRAYDFHGFDSDARPSRLFEFAKLLRLAHGDQKIAGFDAIVGGGVEAHARLALDGEDDDAAILPDARRLDGLAGKRTARGDRYLADLEIHAEMGGGGVEETDHVRTQERMGDALSGKNIGRDNRIGARAAQVLLRHLFAGAGDDAQASDSDCGR